MARPIEKTPMIKGEDAQRFRKSLFVSLNPVMSKTEIKREKQKLKEMNEIYQEFVAVTNGIF
jgi:hypothetical protein